MNQRIVDINPAAQLLLDKVEELGRPEAAGYAAKTHTIKDTEFYARKVVSGESGVFPFKLGDQKKEAGITDISNGKLGVDMLVTGIRISVAKSSGAIADTKASFGAQRFAEEVYDFGDVEADATDMNANEAALQAAGVFAQRIANGIQNSRFSLMVGSQVVLEKGSRAFFRNNATSNEVQGANAHLELSVPKFIAKDEAIDFLFDFLGQAVGNYHAIEVTLIGLTLVPSNVLSK